jgi:hypothetical protein
MRWGSGVEEKWKGGGVLFREKGKGDEQRPQS